MLDIKHHYKYKIKGKIANNILVVKIDLCKIIIIHAINYSDVASHLS